MSTSNQERRPFIAGNWKMHKTGSEAAAYIEELKRLLPSGLDVDVALAPSFTALGKAVEAAKDSPILIAAQNVFWEEAGAYTGEVSVPMLLDLGLKWVIIGHSERRQYFGETDETVNRRLKAALRGGLHPIVCIGETLEQREAEQTFQVLSGQLNQGLSEVSLEDAKNLTIAYEPVWAIGTGRTATPEIAQTAHAFIREELAGIFNKELANSIRILYGGSVKSANASVLLAQADIDGALVGGASLKPDDFLGIINFKGA